MAKKRYTRKELKQPDEFITASGKAWEWVSANAKGVAIGVGVFLLIIAAVAIWRDVVADGERKATAQLTRAVDIANQTVIPGADKLPPDPDGLPRFSTNKAKLVAADAEFSKTIKQHTGGVQLLARLLRAGVRLDMGRFADARKDYTEFLSAYSSEPSAFRTVAIEGLAYAFEGEKNWAGALKALDGLPKKGAGHILALYHRGRLLKASGKTAEAAKAFTEVAKESTSRFLVDQAGQHLAALEIK